jgi:hypothetical protein
VEHVVFDDVIASAEENRATSTSMRENTLPYTVTPPLTLSM